MHTIFQWVVIYFVQENKYSVMSCKLWQCILIQIAISSIINLKIKEVTDSGLDWPTFPVKIVSQIFSEYYKYS